MTVAEAITKSGITPIASYTGIETADDFVFAIQTESAKQTKESAWIVCADHVKEHSGALNASTNSDTFIRTGTVTSNQECHPAHPVGQRQPLRRRCVPGFPALPQDQVRHRQRCRCAVHLFQPAHRQGREGHLHPDRDQRRGRLRRFSGHLCLRRQGHWHPGRVRLQSRHPVR